MKVKVRGVDVSLHLRESRKNTYEVQEVRGWPLWCVWSGNVRSCASRWITLLVRHSSIGIRSCTSLITLYTVHSFHTRQSVFPSQIRRFALATTFSTKEENEKKKKYHCILSCNLGGNKFTGLFLHCVWILPYCHNPILLYSRTVILAYSLVSPTNSDQPFNVYTFPFTLSLFNSKSALRCTGATGLDNVTWPRLFLFFIFYFFHPPPSHFPFRKLCFPGALHWEMSRFRLLFTCLHLDVHVHVVEVEDVLVLVLVLVKTYNKRPSVPETLRTLSETVQENFNWNTHTELP